MKLTDLYLNKLCPHQPRYKCDGTNCAKFLSCMMEEIDTLFVIGGDREKEDAELMDKELMKAVTNDGT